jgi:hypothetical protein
MINGAVIVRVLLLGAVLAGFTPAATIDVNLGVFSFDVLNLSSGQFVGQNQFTIYNFTGANNLAPDFSVVTDILFQNPTVNAGTGPIHLDNIDSSGGGIQPSSLTFLSTDNFTSATFDATVSTTNVQLADGTSLQLSSNHVSGLILPSQGNSLTAGVDFALLIETGTVVETTVPEPSTSGAGFAALLLLIAAGWVSTNRRLTSN